MDDSSISRPEHRLLLGRELKYRIVWLIWLRYAAVAGVLLALFLAPPLVGAVLPFTPVLSIAFVLLGYNLVLHGIVTGVRFQNWYEAGYNIAMIQIFLDLVTLTLLLHWTGGLDNPLVFSYVFHGIIAAILLSRRAAFGQATLAVAMLTTLTILEQTGLVAHHEVGVFGHVGGWGPALTVLLAVSSILFTAVYMTASLSREILARERRCVIANERLVEQDHLKTEYVKLIAHDLKDPLAAIKSTLRVVLDGYAGPVSDQHRQLLERAEHRAERLIELIRDMLDLSRLRSQADRERSRWEFGDLVADVVEQLRPKAEAKGQTIHVDELPGSLEVYANRVAIEQVVLNLVGNAIKYTPEGGAAFISIENGADRFELRVGDTGIGIPEKALPRVFDEFYRASNAKKQTRDGSGLGLAFVKQIVTAYGGAVSVQSPWRPPGTDEPCGTQFVARFCWRRLRPRAESTP